MEVEGITCLLPVTPWLGITTYYHSRIVVLLTGGEHGLHNPLEGQSTSPW